MLHLKCTSIRIPKITKILISPALVSSFTIKKLDLKKNFFNLSLIYVDLLNKLPHKLLKHFILIYLATPDWI